LDKAQLEQTHKRILELKKTKIPHPDPLDMSEVLNIVGHAEHIKIATAIANGVTPDGLLPE
jgi:beta-N-acetylhexosaminidase